MIYFGVVEERSISDEFKVGRCKVRIFGVHSENKADLPTSELPWAIPIQDITSAGVSGIGRSPNGLVEGSWVACSFADEYKQHPVILGVVSGVPFQSPDNTNQEVTEQQVQQRDSTGTVLVDSNGNTVTDGYGNPVVTGNTTPSVLKYPQELSMSDAGRLFIMNQEAISSLTPGKNDYRKNWQSIPDDTLIYAYQDTRGWAIGFGSTYLQNGSKVTASTVLTKAQCIQLCNYKIDTEFVAGIKRNLSAPVTQSMFEAIVDMAYNMGLGGLTRSQFWSALNAGRYDEASAQILVTRANGLANRRQAEQQLFNRDGFPDSSGAVKPTPDQVLAADNTAKANGTYVPPKSYTEITSTGMGFADPNGAYPTVMNEPDSNRLSRAENINETIVAKKDASRVKSVTTANKNLTWRQPPIPYNPTWPYNYVYQTERGHVQEFDDSPNNERIHTWHKSGTYEEIDVNGTKMTHIVGDSYEIFDRDGHVYIKGNCHITIAGDANIRVENDARMQVLGNYSTEVTGNYTVNVAGNISMRAKKGMYLESVDDQTAINGKKLYLNSGFGTGLKEPTEQAGGAIDFPVLITPTRKAMYNAHYETPEEGDPSVFQSANAKQFDEDETKPIDMTNKTTEETKAQDKTPVPISTTCDNLSDSDIKPQYQLSSLFKLGDVLTGSSGYPSGINYGLNSSQIVCNLKKLAVNCLDIIKAKYPNMRITNTWRSQLVNTKVGGSKTSDHLTGCAADIQLQGFTREQHYLSIIEIQKILPAYKQLILEYKGQSTWIHVSYDEKNLKCQNLTIDAGVNKTLSSTGFVLLKDNVVVASSNVGTTSNVRTPSGDAAVQGTTLRNPNGTVFDNVNILASGEVYQTVFQITGPQTSLVGHMRPDGGIQTLTGGYFMPNGTYVTPAGEYIQGVTYAVNPYPQDNVIPMSQVASQLSLVQQQNAQDNSTLDLSSVTFGTGPIISDTYSIIPLLGNVTE